VLHLDRDDGVVAERAGVAHLRAERRPVRLGFAARAHLGRVDDAEIEHPLDFDLRHRALA
jgi:hypothetical protein